MCVAATCRRRRSQARSGFMHLAPMDRPGYKKRDSVTAARRLASQIERERRMASGKNKKK